MHKANRLASHFFIDPKFLAHLHRLIMSQTNVLKAINVENVAIERVPFQALVVGLLARCKRRRLAHAALAQRLEKARFHKVDNCAHFFQKKIVETFENSSGFFMMLFFVRRIARENAVAAAAE